MVPLNPKIFDKDVQTAPIRKGFGEGNTNQTPKKEIENARRIADALD